ncbi:hypothetical protein JCM11251_005857 [Rhodosporidiobolus azoricus]
MSTRRLPPSQMGLLPLSSPSLSSSLSHHQLSETESRLLLAARMGQVYAKREVEGAWKKFDRRMEDSEWLGNGREGSPFEFTRQQWDGLKKATTDAVHEGEHRVAVLKSQLAASPALSTALSPYYAHSTTSALNKGVSVHGQMAKQYLGYAARDAQNAMDQVQMAVGEEAEVVRRGIVRRLQEGQGESSSTPSIASASSPFHPIPRRPHFASPNGFPSAHNPHLLADGLLNAAGVAVDVGMGVAAGEWVERRARRNREEGPVAVGR